MKPIKVIEKLNESYSPTGYTKAMQAILDGIEDDTDEEALQKYLQDIIGFCRTVAEDFGVLVESNSGDDFETYTDYSGDKPVEKKRHTTKYCTIAAAEFVRDNMYDEFGANWRDMPQDEMIDAIAHYTNVYNDANVEPEYEGEDFYGDEANYNEVYDYLLGRY